MMGSNGVNISECLLYCAYLPSFMPAPQCVSLLPAGNAVSIVGYFQRLHNEKEGIYILFCLCFVVISFFGRASLVPQASVSSLEN